METGLLDYWNVKLRTNGIANWNWEAILHNAISYVLIDLRRAYCNISSFIYSLSDKKEKKANKDFQE